jgi:hypothetical protein
VTLGWSDPNIITRPGGLSELAGAWSTYWYNNFIYASSGRVQAGRPGNRGLDVYMLLGKNGRLVDPETGMPTVTAANAGDPSVQQFKGRIVRYMNPQTQDTFQNTSHGR